MCLPFLKEQIHPAALRVTRPEYKVTSYYLQIGNDFKPAGLPNREFNYRWDSF